MTLEQAVEPVTTDLSGLDVHDIEQSPAARHASTPAEVTDAAERWSQRPRRSWRWRVMRWAAAAAVMVGIVFFALLGEAVFINYFPALEHYDLRLPDAPVPGSRLPRTNVPIPVPEDVTLPPPQ